MNGFVLRIKLLLKDRATVACYIISTAVVIAVLFGLNLHAVERSSIPIGVFNCDDSSEAEALLEKLKDNAALYVYEGDYDYLSGLLMDGYINSIFVISEDYGSCLRSGDTAGIMKVYAAEDDRTSVIVSDIVAGCMMFEICVDKAYLSYKSLPAPENPPEDYEALSRAGFKDFVTAMREDEDFRFSFDMSFVDAGEEKTSGEISNGVIYRQMIAGIMAMLIALLTFCACNTVSSERERGIYLRKRILPGAFLPGTVKEAAGVFVFVLPFCLLAAAVIGSEGGAAAALKLLVLNVAFAFLMSLLFYLLAVVCRSIFSYQLIGAAVIIAFGAMGFLNVFGAFIGTEMFGYVPNSVYIRFFAGIIG